MGEAAPCNVLVQLFLISNISLKLMNTDQQSINTEVTLIKVAKLQVKNRKLSSACRPVINVSRVIFQFLVIEK